MIFAHKLIDEIVANDDDSWIDDQIFTDIPRQIKADARIDYYTDADNRGHVLARQNLRHIG